jgi:hypothetical protein
MSVLVATTKPKGVEGRGHEARLRLLKHALTWPAVLAGLAVVAAVADVINCPGPHCSGQNSVGVEHTRFQGGPTMVDWLRQCVLVGCMPTLQVPLQVTFPSKSPEMRMCRHLESTSRAFKAQPHEGA